MHIFFLMFHLFESLLFPPTVLAQSASSISISPAFQEVVLTNEGQKEEKSISLRNSSSSTLKFVFSVVPITQVDEYGRIAFVDKPEFRVPTQTVDYVQLPSGVMELKPGEEKKLKYLVVNTPSLPPGGSYAAILGRVENSSEQNQQVLPAISSLIMVRKNGGESIVLKVEKVSGLSSVIFLEPKKVDLTIKNTGNVHAIPRGVLHFTDILGKETFRGTLNDGSLLVLPQTSRVIRATIIPISRMFPIMWYSVELDGRDDVLNARYSWKSSFVFINVPVLGILITCLVVARILFVRIRSGLRTRYLRTLTHSKK